MATTKNKNSTNNTIRIIHFSAMTPGSLVDSGALPGRIGGGDMPHVDFL